jgi:tetratricopeptide (TPR) repeat protein
MLGRAIQYQGRFEEASRIFAQALQIAETTYGADHPRVGVVLNHMGILALDRRDLDLAQGIFERASRIFERLGKEHEFHAYQQSNLGAVFFERGQFERAEQYIRPALERLRAGVGENHRLTAMAHLRLARCLSARRRYIEAEPHARQAYKAFIVVTGPDNVEAHAARETVNTIYEELNQPEKRISEPTTGAGRLLPRSPEPLVQSPPG